MSFPRKKKMSKEKEIYINQLPKQDINEDKDTYETNVERDACLCRIF